MIFQRKENQTSDEAKLAELAHTLGATVTVVTTDVCWESLEVTYKGNQKKWDSASFMMFTGSPEAYDKVCRYAHQWLIRESTRRTVTL